MKPLGAHWGPRRRAATAALLLVAVGCSRPGSDAVSHAASPGDLRADRVCELSIMLPNSYTRLDQEQVRAFDKVGMRTSYRGPEGVRIHLTAGIDGEFGEALPLVDQIPVPSAQDGRLLGVGRTWILTWDQGDVCGTRSITGDGFDREGFLALLVKAGVTPPDH